MTTLGGKESPNPKPETENCVVKKKNIEKYNIQKFSHGMFNIWNYQQGPICIYLYIYSVVHM